MSDSVRIQTVDAIYDDGVFRPLEQVDLAAHAQVRITIESRADQVVDRTAALRRFRELCLASQFRSNGRLPTRDELHERR